MNTIERDYFAYLDEMNVITILIPHTLDQHDMSSFQLECNEEIIELSITERIHLHDFIKYICHVSEEIKIGYQYYIRDPLQRRTDLQIGAVTRTENFDHTFFYDGTLGVQYQKNHTFFTLWAPTATMVKIKLTSPDGLNQEMLEMSRGEKGVWTVQISGDLENYRYLYFVCVNLKWSEAIDPYVVAVTANGEEGVIVDLNKTKISKPTLPTLSHPVDSVIYETHIRDLTIHPNSGVKHKGYYTGAAELGTTDPDGNLTGLSYVKDLGITHIEILPLHDFAGVDELGEKKDYNWGYNPLHFNVPDGSYSLDPTNPYQRINELKELINSIHQQGIRVIVDVVYNHVYEREDSSFEKIVPGYYFRHDEHGMPSNGTGVGNDIASERKMVRKFIIDSVLFWLQEYQIDGFRFDLMGILDTDTMREIRESIDQYDPSVLVIGEGWDLNTPLYLEKKANIHNQSELPRIGQFNDWFRDSIKGSTFNIYDKGFALGNGHYYDMAKQVMAASVGLKNAEEGLFLEPDQSVNYVESHDNHTLWDKLLVCLSDENGDTLRSYHRLATAMVLISQGIPFLHSGQEFFRTKNGDGNSYKSNNEINQLDWDRRQEFQLNVNYMKGLIKIRQYHGAFRLQTTEEIRKHMRFLPLKKPLIGCYLVDVTKYGPWDSILLLINPTKSEETIELPQGNWNLIANKEISGTTSIKRIVDHKIILKPISCFILIKD